MEVAPNPIDIIEEYFNTQLKAGSLGHFDEIDTEVWIDFSKHYLAVMQSGFASAYLDAQSAPTHAVRLYFEPSFGQDWQEILAGRSEETPLLTHRAYAPESSEVTREQVSAHLNPLKKHLLLADSVFIRDNFYYCFDMIADTVSRSKWSSNPNVVSLVKNSIKRIRAFLPILTELRNLIKSDALVFMPYYITPTFPYANIPTELQGHVDRLKIVDPSGIVWSNGIPSGKLNKVLVPWLNARLLGLDPVFLTEEMAQIGATMSLDEGMVPSPPSDLLSVNILPFGGPGDVDLDTLWKMRRNEDVFASVRRLTTECKIHLEENLGEGATQKAASALSKEFLRDHLNSQPMQKAISFSEKPAVAFAFRTTLAVATLGASEVTAILASALLDVSVGDAVLSRVSPERQAIAYLNSVL